MNEEDDKSIIYRSNVNNIMLGAQALSIAFVKTYESFLLIFHICWIVFGQT